MLDPIRLGVPLTDPAWTEARRGRPPANAGKVYGPEPLSGDEVLAMLARCSPRTPTGIRNRALLVVLWRAGLRVGEAVGRHHKVTGQWLPGIMPRDVDREHRLIRVQHGAAKGRRRKGAQVPRISKPRTVGIDPLGLAVIELWLAERERLGIPRTVQLFCTIAADAGVYGARYRPLTPAYVRNLVKRLAAAAGVERRVHPHALRHTLAFELMMEGKPLAMIQQQLGHSDPAVTGKYVAHFAPAALPAALAERGWPGDPPAAAA